MSKRGEADREAVYIPLSRDPREVSRVDMGLGVATMQRLKETE